MIVEQKLLRLGLVVPDLEQDYATNPSGARFTSHFAVRNVLYLSGTAPVKNGEAYLPVSWARTSASSRATRRRATPCSIASRR